MPKVTYVQPNGAQRTLEVATGTSVMQAAMDEGLPGIVAECGGSAMCATCHVFVDPAWAPRLPPMELLEAEMLESTAEERQDNSRLSCQIFVTPELDGLVVRLPERQT